jgi:hypothetical protein
MKAYRFKKYREAFAGEQACLVEDPVVPSSSFEQTIIGVHDLGVLGRLHVPETKEAAHGGAAWDEMNGIIDT